MTWSAPIEATISTFFVLHTPVTSAPNALASCTVNVPTPPDAPLTRTFCPGRTRPLSRSACKAAHPGDRHRRRLLERYIGRLFQRHRVLADADVLGECSPVFEAAE